MSEELRKFYRHQIFNDHDHDRDQLRSPSGGGATFPYSGSHSSSTFSTDYSSFHGLQMFDSPLNNFTDFPHGSADYNSFSGASFGLSSSVVEAVGGEIPATPNSPATSSSSETAPPGDEYTNIKGKKKIKAKETAEDVENSSKKEVKAKKKRPKKPREPRFAFMTKSEVDNLEDGYRWRKYGQKAVKNSPYPRSYYRCTTEKCPVKKRLERSFVDPSIVITTYEGHHNHHEPASRRGDVARMFAPSMLTPPLPQRGQNQSFPLELLVQMPPHQYLYGYDHGSYTSSLYDHHQQTLNQHQQQQFHQFPDYGLSQDIIPPSVFPNSTTPETTFHIFQ